MIQRVSSIYMLARVSFALTGGGVRCRIRDKFIEQYELDRRIKKAETLSLEGERVRASPNIIVLSSGGSRTPVSHTVIRIPHPVVCCFPSLQRPVAHRLLFVRDGVFA